MAYDNSDAIAPGASYSLGEYTFTLQNVVSEDERILQAHISGPEGTAAQGITVPTSTQVKSWYVEANETEASVYVQTEGFDFSGLMPLAPGSTAFFRSGFPESSWESGTNVTLTNTGTSIAYVFVLDTGGRYCGALVSDKPTSVEWVWSGGDSGSWSLTYDSALGAYYVRDPASTSDSSCFNGSMPIQTREQLLARKGGNQDSGSYLVGRFAIDIREADGGPGGGWDEPGDVGEPSYTLNLTVTGATSGTHIAANVPTDARSQEVYGSGGIGGNGGGGGAGASTVIIYDFATAKAGNVNQEAIAQPPGVGGPGGKGGKGGDGCILIFY